MGTDRDGVAVGDAWKQALVVRTGRVTRAIRTSGVGGRWISSLPERTGAYHDGWNPSGATTAMAGSRVSWVGSSGVEQTVEARRVGGANPLLPTILLNPGHGRVPADAQVGTAYRCRGIRGLRPSGGHPLGVRSATSVVSAAPGAQIG